MYLLMEDTIYIVVEKIILCRSKFVTDKLKKVRRSLAQDELVGRLCYYQISRVFSNYYFILAI